MKKLTTIQQTESGIRIVEVRVRNFRVLKSIDLCLARLTVLIGPNNSGKTSFLEALFAAMGAGRRVLNSDDIFISPEETNLPQDRSILIDVLIKPTDNKGKFCDNFPEGSYWLNLWRNGIAQDDDDKDFIAFRTRLQWKHESGEYSIERQFLGEWASDSSRLEDVRINSKAGTVTAKQLEPLALHFMDAKRDIDDDMKRQGSFWRRMTNNLGLSESDIESFEKILTEINEEIVEKSEVLRHLKSTLGDLDSIMSGGREGVELAPVARKLRDLTKGIDVNFTTKGSQTFPLVRHGMGTRSMASILVFRAFMQWRSLQAKEDAVHPMLALEEPEAHLHPQAQRALFSQIMEIPGQVIISTHSPYVAAYAEFGDLRHFRKEGADTTVTAMDISDLNPDDLQKMKWKVLNTRGDMLFANALVLFEGETEEQAFAIFAQEYWGRNPNELGVNFIGVGGAGSYLPFLRLAKGFEIEWYIFSDAENKPLEDMSAALMKIGITDYKSCSNVVVLPEGKNFETYLVDEGYADVIDSTLNRHHDADDYVTDYIGRMNDQKMKGGKTRNYTGDGDGGRKRASLDILKEGKTVYTEAITRGIVALEEKNRRIPGKIKELFNQIPDVTGKVIESGRKPHEHSSVRRSEKGC
ncbi:MAG: AAA family ATPase [Firmicutes bacterium]|nr:AAA family ATPase [Bacillota bacterium]MBV1726926.1 AAA family ATPase [Desulforudis sp.]MBU4533969.1 AAA family ATPase [Bacillota bacterium]MBU4554238.1 AAA family ATPase [Bacillota bacterium]MBV1734787.1 AAA family ATPase [Desulforudis sp.]